MKPHNRKPATICAGFVFLLLASRAGVAPFPSVDREKAVVAYREGNALFDQGLFSQAIAAYNQAIAEDPQYVQAYHNLALASEMVDRQQAIAAWKRFVDIAVDREEYKFDVARIRARIQILESLPPLPDSLLASRYVPESGDYYWQVSRGSEGEEWTQFPLKVFLGSAPDMKWQEGVREAFDFWGKIVPLQLVALPQTADIRVSWEQKDFERGQAGEEEEYLIEERVGEGTKLRRIAIISVDIRLPWSKDHMRAIISHEMGHALGIKGHSDSKKDIMYWESREKTRRYTVSGVPLPFIFRSLVKQPSQRDVNTLIRLYNHAGSSVRFR